MKKLFWPTVGLAAVAVSLWLLYDELRWISLDDVGDGLAAIPPHRWLLSALATVVAYLALAGYDHIALTHLRRDVGFLFVTLCSFTTYALSHNIGGSVLSGAVIRYRAYATQGLSAQEVGVLVGICWLTFVLSMVLLGSIVLLVEPDLLYRYADFAGGGFSVALGVLGLAIVGAYAFGSWLHLKPLRFAGLELHYPSLPIMARQLLVGPAEILAAAAIIHFALPAAGHPGYLVVLGVFIVAFAAAQISHAPGGLGVLEIVFLAGMPEMHDVSVLAALLVFRLFYLIVPLVLAIGIVLGFERAQFRRT
jgi:uncharacterized membrane protein YbhN (UPF0104 family)